MNLYQIVFDATHITVKANSQDEAFELVRARDSNFKKDLKDNKYYYHFDEDYKEQIEFHNIPEKPGIIQWESH
mgnify:FL=1